MGDMPYVCAACLENNIAKHADALVYLSDGAMLSLCAEHTKQVQKEHIRDMIDLENGVEKRV